jgi:hypothetical protein
MEEDGFGPLGKKMETGRKKAKERKKSMKKISRFVFNLSKICQKFVNIFVKHLSIFVKKIGQKLVKKVDKMCPPWRSATTEAFLSHSG